MRYNVTRIIEPNDQVYKAGRFGDLDKAIAEAELPIFVPLRIKVVVQDNDGIEYHRTYTGKD